MRGLQQPYVSMTQGEQGIGRNAKLNEWIRTSGSPETSCMYKVYAKVPGQNTQDQAPGRRREEERRYATERSYTGYRQRARWAVSARQTPRSNLFMSGVFHRGCQRHWTGNARLWVASKRMVRCPLRGAADGRPLRDCVEWKCAVRNKCKFTDKWVEKKKARAKRRKGRVPVKG